MSILIQLKGQSHYLVLFVVVKKSKSAFRINSGCSTLCLVVKLYYSMVFLK